MWSIRWTATMSASGEEGKNPHTVMHYPYINTASMICREYPDGHVQTADFHMRMGDQLDRTVTQSCTDGKGNKG